ncbi:MAG: MFS transporter, partial [Acidobacteriaceae bacterium]
VLVVADLTRGTGRFNLTLGAIAAAVGTGASLSQVIAGAIVHHAGFRVGFLFLSAIALLAFTLLYRWMPETLHLRTQPE